MSRKFVRALPAPLMAGIIVRQFAGRAPYSKEKSRNSFPSTLPA
jgi:hypothetical protein